MSVDVLTVFNGYDLKNESLKPVWQNLIMETENGDRPELIPKIMHTQSVN